MVIDSKIRCRSRDRLNPWSCEDLPHFLVNRHIKELQVGKGLGFNYVILRPIFSIVFGGLAWMHRKGIPCPLYSCGALVPSSHLQTAIIPSTTSLIK
jgi:hypothetical protein